MEITCVICSHTDRTEEQRERHVETEEHIRNEEIYTMGLEHGQQHREKQTARIVDLVMLAGDNEKQIATLEARIKELEAALSGILDTVYDSNASGTNVDGRWMGIPDWEVFDAAKELVTK